MTITLGAGPVVFADGASGSTIVLSLTGTTAGRSIVIGGAWESLDGITSITCSGESDLTVVKLQQTSWSACVAYLLNNVNGGDKTITINLAGNAFQRSGWAAEFIDVSGIDATAGGSSTSTNPSINLTTGVDNALVVGTVVNGGGTPSTNGAAYTGIVSGGTSGSGEYDLDGSTAGLRAVNFVNAGTNFWVEAAASFSGPVPPTIIPGAGSLAINGLAPTVYPLVVTPPAGSLTLSGLSPSQTLNVSVPVGSAQLTGYAPTRIQTTEITPGVGSLIATAFAPASDVSFSLLLRTLVATGGPGAYAAFGLPLRTLSASGVVGAVGTAEFDTPLRTIVGTGNDGAQFATPLRTLVATGVIGAVGSSSFVTPRRSISSAGTSGVIGGGSFNLLLRTLSTNALSGIIGAAEFSVPRRTLLATGLTGVVGTAALPLLLRTLVASGYNTITGIAAFATPLRHLDAQGFTTPAENYRGWVMNLRTGALTEYEGFNFNGMAKFGTRYIASGPDGLYVLDGDDDNGVAIDAVLRTGLPNYGNSFLKRIPRAYISGTQAGALLFSTISSEDGKRTYNLSDNGIRAEQQRRVPIGRGPKSVRWAFEIVNVDGSDFGISQILIYPMNLRRRIM